MLNELSVRVQCHFPMVYAEIDRYAMQQTTLSNILADADNILFNSALYKGKPVASLFSEMIAVS